MPHLYVALHAGIHSDSSMPRPSKNPRSQGVEPSPTPMMPTVGDSSTSISMPFLMSASAKIIAVIRPAVQHARDSAESLGRYLRAFDKGSAVDVLMMPPHVNGRLFYNDDMTGFNFSRIKASIGEVSDKLIRYSKFDNRPSLAAQSAP